MKKRMVILTVSLIAVVGIIVGVSYAFFSIGGSQEQANTFTSGCLNISLTDASSSISLSNIYPVTDVEGLETASYDFTITNTCDTSANYSINLESLNQVVNSLSADYIKVALSSDTVDNVISILSDNTSVTPEIDGAYESYNLYTGTLGASETKTYHLKLWIDYDATVEEAANKVYQSKINVIANPETQVVDTLEATFELNDKTLTTNLTNNVTSATYCTTTDNICTPNTSVNISNNSYTVDLSTSKTKQVATALGNITVNVASSQIVCTRLNGTSKVICSNPNKINTPDFSKTAQANCEGIENCEETNGIYEAEDDYGTSYYYRGAVTNNYVSFAGYYWRIIRINGDGSIRIIYDGTSAHENGESSSDRQIGISAFNEQYNDNAYVGYMYGTPGSDNYEETHTNTNSSTIKGVLDNWYIMNIINKDYGQYISTEAGFCNDRQTASGVWSTHGILGYGNNATDYAPAGRLISNGSWKKNQMSNLKCNHSNDMFSVSSSSKGNHALMYPVGLITSDEVLLVGGLGGTNNNSYYLYTGQYYWTMSPYYFSNVALVFFVNSNGNLGSDGYYVHSEWGVRPVINLAADVTITGSGTMQDPYVVS